MNHELGKQDCFLLPKVLMEYEEGRGEGGQCKHYTTQFFICKQQFNEKISATFILYKINLKSQ